MENIDSKDSSECLLGFKFEPLGEKELKLLEEHNRYMETVQLNRQEWLEDEANEPNLIRKEIEGAANGKRVIFTVDEIEEILNGTFKEDFPDIDEHKESDSDKDFDNWFNSEV